MRSTKLALCAAMLLTFGLAGCSGKPGESTAPAATSNADAGTQVSVASLTAGEAVPAPSGKPVLSVTGKITHGNKKGAVALDLATIELLGVRQVGLYEPWVKQNLEFRGVWLADLLTVAGVADGATKLHITAHDDYTVDIPLADVKAGDIMLATRNGDGTGIVADNGGPTRVVYLNGVAAGANPDQWIWSLKSIEVQ